MSTRKQLSEDASVLSDGELISRLRSGELTEIATEVARRELVERGIDVEHTVNQASHVSARAIPPAAAFGVAAASQILRRMLRFPLHAVLGVEPLWAVALFGGAIVFVIQKLVRWGISQLLIYPVPPYALPIAYAALGIIALAIAWWGIALWRTGSREKIFFWKLLAHIAAVLCAITAIWGTMGAARVAQEYLVTL